MILCRFSSLGEGALDSSLCSGRESSKAQASGSVLLGDVQGIRIHICDVEPLVSMLLFKFLAKQGDDRLLPNDPRLIWCFTLLLCSVNNAGVGAADVNVPPIDLCCYYQA